MKNKLKIMRNQYDRACQKIHHNLKGFVSNQSGAAEGGTPGWVLGLFVGAVLLIIVFAIFKEKLPGFIDGIFSKFDNLG